MASIRLHHGLQTCSGLDECGDGRPQAFNGLRERFDPRGNDAPIALAIEGAAKLLQLGCLLPNAGGAEVAHRAFQRVGGTVQGPGVVQIGRGV